MALGVFALGAPIGAWLGANMAGAIANAYGWRAAFLALGIPGVIMGTIIYMTIREPQRGRLDAVADSCRAADIGVTAVPVAATSRIPCRHGHRRVRALGMGTDLVHSRLSDAHLRSQRRRSRSGHRTTFIWWAALSATAGTAWILSRRAMADPRRVVWLLALGVRLATIPSFMAYWTHSLWVAKAMFWLFIPAIYFYIGPAWA